MKRPSFTRSRASFTLIELLVVIAIIVVLAGLVVGGAGFANKKAARARAQAEIAAMSAALESYKADNGIYPEATLIGFSGGDYSASPATTSYKNASLILYRALSADLNNDGKVDSATVNGTVEKSQKTYMEFKDNQLERTAGAVSALIDPFGYAYGYSTIYNSSNGTQGFNPTFDLWSTGGRTGSTPADRANWITNW